MRRRNNDTAVRRSVYTYPRLISWLLPIIGYFLIAVALYHFFYRTVFFIATGPLGVYDPTHLPAWAILRGDLPIVHDLFNSYYTSLLPSLYVPTYWWAIQSLLGLIFAVILITFYNNLLPSVRVLDDVLEIRYGTRWLQLPWPAISKIRSAEFFGGKWFVVLIEAEEGYLKPIHNLYSLLFGSTAGPGIIVTSDIKGFDDLIKDVLNHKLDRWTAPRLPKSAAEVVATDPLTAVLDENYFAAPLKAGLEARESMGLLTGMNEGGIAAEEPDPTAVEEQPQTAPPPERLPITRGQAIGAAVTLAAFPVAYYLVDALMFGPHLLSGFDQPIKVFSYALTLFIISLFETVVGAGVIFALGELFTGRSDRALFRLELIAYPFTQLPRILAMMVALTLLVAHIGWLAVLVWLGSIVWGAWNTALLTMRIYPLKLDRAALGGLATLVYGILILLTYGVFRFWPVQLCM